MPARKEGLGPLVRITLDCGFDDLHGFYAELSESFYKKAHPEMKAVPKDLAACVTRNAQALHEELVPSEPCFISVKGSKLSVEELRGQPLLVISHERFRSAYPVRELRTAAVKNHQTAIQAVIDTLRKHGVPHRAYDAAKGEVPA